jgi:hypothetical protein
MWEPRRLIILWTSTACYRDSFTFFFVPRFSAYQTLTTSPRFPHPDQNKYGPFLGHAGCPGLIPYWLARLCGRTSGNWQVVLVLQLVPSVLRASQQELTCCHASPSGFLHKPKFGQADRSACYLLHVGFLLGLVFDPEYGDDMFL